MTNHILSFLDYLLNVKRYSSHTVVSYENDLESFSIYTRDEYEIEDIDQVNHLIIRSWIASLKEEGLSNSSINRKISALKSFYKYLRRNEVVKINPMAKVLTLKKSKRLPSFVPKDKMSKLAEPTLHNGDFSTMRDDLIILLLYSTGIRRSELINLKISDIDASRGEMRVLGKGNKERLCPISKDILSIIDKYKDLRVEVNSNLEPFLFLTDNGKKCYPKLIYNVVSRRMKAINAADKTSPHVLRHTFATHLSGNGAELNAVKELLGHASLAATQVYTHNSIERLQNEYKKAHPKGE